MKNIAVASEIPPGETERAMRLRRSSGEPRLQGE